MAAWTANLLLGPDGATFDSKNKLIAALKAGVSNLNLGSLEPVLRRISGRGGAEHRCRRNFLRGGDGGDHQMAHTRFRRTLVPVLPEDSRGGARRSTHTLCDPPAYAQAVPQLPTYKAPARALHPVRDWLDRLEILTPN